MALVNQEGSNLLLRRRRTWSTGLSSKFFENGRKGAQEITLLASSSIVPALGAQRFGLIQEALATDPFQLLVAVILLIKTKPSVALPAFWSLMETYPTPEKFAQIDFDELVEIISHLGLQHERAVKLIGLAKYWVLHPPTKHQRFRTLNYPRRGDGADIAPDEVLVDEDVRVGAWEIAHLPGCGAYALDSWRIFCRDFLRGIADGYRGEGAFEGFEPEWKRVMPQDKELRAYLWWVWLREQGMIWDPITGNRRLASKALLERAGKGNLAWNMFYAAVWGARNGMFLFSVETL